MGAAGHVCGGKSCHRYLHQGTCKSSPALGWSSKREQIIKNKEQQSQGDCQIKCSSAKLVVLLMRMLMMVIIITTTVTVIISTLANWFVKTSLKSLVLGTSSCSSVPLLPKHNEVQAKKQIHCKLYKRFGAKMKLLKTTSVKMG